MNGLIAVAAGVEAFLLDLAGHPRGAILRAERRHPGAERRRIRRLGREPLDERMLGREQHERRAVDRVDARREDLDRVGSAPRRPSPTSGNRTRAPSDRPIQLRCIVRTFSGQLVELVERVEQLVGVRA